MTITQTKPAADEATDEPGALAAASPAADSDAGETQLTPRAPAAGQPPASPPTNQPTPARGLAALLSTGDSALIGRLWTIFAFGFGVFAIVAGFLVSLERATGTGIDIFTGHRSHFLFFSAHHLTLALLCVAPLFIGLAHAVVPRQIGAESTAYPRLSMTAFATWLIGAVVMLTSWGIDGGLAPGGDTDAVELSLLSLMLIALGLAAAAANLAATVIVQRSPAYPRLVDVPPFAFSILVAASIWVISFAVLLGNLMVMWVDTRGPFAAKYGQGENLYDQLSWLVTQQQIFAFALPLLGVVACTLSHNLGGPPQAAAATAATPAVPRASRAHITINTIIALFAIPSFGAPIQNFFNPESHSSPIYVVAPFVGLVIILALLGAFRFLAVERRTLPRRSPALLVAALALLLLLGSLVLAATRTVGQLVGVLRIFSDERDFRADLDRLLQPFDDLLTTTAISSVFHAVMLAGLLGAVAGLYFWAPLVLNTRLKNPVGLLSGLLIFAGALLYSVPDMISGFWGQPDAPAATRAQAQALSETFAANSQVEALNVLSLIGVIAVLAGLAFIALDVLRAVGKNLRREANVANVSAA